MSSGFNDIDLVVKQEGREGDRLIYKDSEKDMASTRMLVFYKKEDNTILTFWQDCSLKGELENLDIGSTVKLASTGDQEYTITEIVRGYTPVLGSKPLYALKTYRFQLSTLGKIIIG